MLYEEEGSYTSSVAQTIYVRGGELSFVNGYTLAEWSAVRAQTELLRLLCGVAGLRLAEWSISGGRYSGDIVAGSGDTAEQLFAYLMDIADGTPP